MTHIVLDKINCEKTSQVWTVDLDWYKNVIFRTFKVCSRSFIVSFRVEAKQIMAAIPNIKQFVTVDFGTFVSSDQVKYSTFEHKLYTLDHYIVHILRVHPL